MLNPHLLQNQVLSWQWFRQITVISESMSAFSSEGKGLNYHDPLVDVLLVPVGGLRKGLFSALFTTLASDPPGDTENMLTQADKLSHSPGRGSKFRPHRDKSLFPSVAFWELLSSKQFCSFTISLLICSIHPCYPASSSSHFPHLLLLLLFSSVQLHNTFPFLASITGPNTL